MRTAWIKRLLLWVFSVIVGSVFTFYGFSANEVPVGETGRLVVEPGNSSLHFDRYDLTVKGFDSDNCTFFFLPSYINIKKIDQSVSGLKICSGDGIEMLEPEVNKIQEVIVRNDADGSVTPWKLGVFQSENLYTVDISLPDRKYYEIDHYTYSPASVDVYSPTGRVVFHEAEAQIKGRGNSSWLPDPEFHKEPYQIRLSGDYPLCGMKSADIWALIKNDPTGLRNKLTYDLSSEIGMEYAIESDWVDVYINGDYMGNYLLCHEPDIGRSDLDIGSLSAFNRKCIGDAEIAEYGDMKGYDYTSGSAPVPDGGYLVEKNAHDRYEKKDCGFVSGDDYFTIKSPDNASLDEVNYILDFVCKTDDMIHDTGGDQTDMIDPFSFARQYLLNEISLDPDGGFTSYFFYKKPKEERLYAGPCWDFDGAYGRWTDPIYKDYTGSIFDIQDHVSADSGNVALDWDRVLLENEDYRKYVASVFCECMPAFETALAEKIDEHYDRIHCSLHMDQIRWEGYEGYEEVIRNSYKQLKFFLYQRLEHLTNIYGGVVSVPEPDIYDGSYHTLTFIYEDGHTEEMKVLDGAQVKQYELPEYDESKYDGWRSDDQYMSLLSYYDPIFEDRSFVLAHY